MFKKVLFEVIKTANKKNIKSFETLQRLRGESVFDTFLNVRVSENLYNLQKEVKSLKKTFAKPDRCLPKEEIKLLSKKQKAVNEALRSPFYQAIETTKLKPRTEQEVAIKEIRQNIFKERLKIKQEQGEAVSKLDVLELNNPKFRDIKKEFTNRIRAAGMITLFGLKDIKEANEKCGTEAAVEEIGKTAAMCFIGLSALKYINTQLKNIITTISIYCPGGRFLKGMSLPLAILSTMTIKPIMDKCWETKYEKFLLDNCGFNVQT